MGGVSKELTDDGGQVQAPTVLTLTSRTGPAEDDLPRAWRLLPPFPDSDPAGVQGSWWRERAGSTCTWPPSLHILILGD